MTPRAQRRDEGALLALAGFILAVALLTVAASANLLSSGQQEVVRSGRGDVLGEFHATRARLIDFFESQPQGAERNALQNDLNAYLSSGFGGTTSKNYEVSAVFASTGIYDGNNVEASEFNHTGAGACATGPTYTTLTHDGSNPWSTLCYDGTDDGIVHNQNGNAIGVMVRLEVRSPTASVTEIVVVQLLGGL